MSEKRVFEKLLYVVTRINKLCQPARICSLSGNIKNIA